MQRLEDTSTTYSVGFAIGSYSICSSTLLLANKMALHYIPYPCTVTLMQLLFSVFVVYVLKYMFQVEVDGFEWSKIKPYLLYIFAFIMCLYSNMNALKYSNVETVIVFRSCSPILVSMIEYLLMGRLFPSMRSLASLILILLFALLYCLSDSEFQLNGLIAYSWVIIYLVMITLEMTYGKKLTSSVKMASVWGPVLYCNVLALIPFFMLGMRDSEFPAAFYQLRTISFSTLMILLFSCVTGTLIGYSGWYCRGMVSATTYTLVGVVNKFITILLNVIIWEKHSTWLGILSVCCCMLSGVFYQQSPRRDESHKSEEHRLKMVSTTPTELLTVSKEGEGGVKREDGDAVEGVDIDGARDDDKQPLLTKKKVSE